jgi:AcrR family transcriptional regulator
MENKKEYRNAVRSRNMIRSAFMELLNEKNFEKITATDIINRADINRSTFYAHYPDARGLLDEILKEIVKMFENKLASIDFSVFFDDPKPILMEVIGFLEGNQKLYQKLNRSKMATPILEQLKRVLIRTVMECPNLPVKNVHDPAVSIRVRILLGGLIDTYRLWLEGEFVCSLDEATEVVACVIKSMYKDFQENL